MKIKYLSDTHIDSFSNNNAYDAFNFFYPCKLGLHEYVLVIAGDVCNFSSLYFQFISECCKYFKHVIVVPGNHEYYEYSLEHVNKTAKNIEKNFSNFTYLCCTENLKIIDDVAFIGDILWTDINFDDFCKLHCFINDFLKIHEFQKLSNVNKKYSKYYSYHCRSLESISQSINKCKDFKTVVITHHGPDISLIPHKYKNKRTNGFFFCNNINHDLFSKIDYWLFGHTHQSVFSEINGCKFKCNPFGYKDKEENISFNPELEIIL